MNVRTYNKSIGYQVHDNILPVDAVVNDPQRRDRWDEEHRLYDLEQSTFFPRRGRR